MKIWLLRLCLGALTLSSAHAMGLAAIKEQAFHEDSSASIFVFNEMIDSGAPFIKFKVTPKDLTFDRGKVASSVEIPSSVPENIVGPEDISPLKSSLADLTAFSRRFPKSEGQLAIHIATLSENISRFDKGEVRYRGKWMAAGDYASIQETKGKQGVMLSQEEQRRQERLEILRAEKEKIAVAQRARGLVEYNGQWLTKDEAARRRQSDNETATAEELILQKTIRDTDYMVQQITDEGLLITPEKGSGNKKGDEVTLIFLHGSGRSSAFPGDIFRGDLYWAGTYTYASVSGIQRTVNAYSLKYPDALAKAMASLRAKDGKATVTTADGKKPGLNPIFDDVKGSGSGFFVGTAGHFVTNAHVVKDAKSVEIYLDGKVIKAKVLAVDTKGDMALLKADKPTQGLEIVAEDVETGQDIYTIGFPRPTLQGIEVKITKGIISSRSGLLNDESLYQLDASIQPGNSGGPVCDSKGRVLGVVVSMLARAGDTIPQNVNYAIKSRVLLSFLTSNNVTTATPPVFTDAGLPVEGSIRSATASTAMVIVK